MKNPQVLLETTEGLMTIELFQQKAPVAVENFLLLVQRGYYDGVIFHRVIKGFMIQGGDPTGTGRGGESAFGHDFDDEFDPTITFNKKGLLAMANRGPKTNGSQFFITTAQTSWLNHHHTIFGEVVSGYDAVQKIENSETDRSDKPLKEQKIIRATVLA